MAPRLKELRTNNRSPRIGNFSFSLAEVSTAQSRCNKYPSISRALAPLGLLHTCQSTFLSSSKHTQFLFFLPSMYRPQVNVCKTSCSRCDTQKKKLHSLYSQRLWSTYAKARTFFLDGVLARHTVESLITLLRNVLFPLTMQKKNGKRERTSCGFLLLLAVSHFHETDETKRRKLLLSLHSCINVALHILSYTSNTDFRKHPLTHSPINHSAAFSFNFYDSLPPQKVSYEPPPRPCQFQHDLSFSLMLFVFFFSFHDTNSGRKKKNSSDILGFNTL